MVWDDIPQAFPYTPSPVNSRTFLLKLFSPDGMGRKVQAAIKYCYSAIHLPKTYLQSPVSVVQSLIVLFT